MIKQHTTDSTLFELALEGAAWRVLSRLGADIERVEAEENKDKGSVKLSVVLLDFYHGDKIRYTSIYRSDVISQQPELLESMVDEQFKAGLSEENVFTL